MIYDRSEGGILEPELLEDKSFGAADVSANPLVSLEVDTNTC